MRRGTGFVLVLFGLCCLGLAPILRWNIAPRISKAPLAAEFDLVLAGNDARYLDVDELQVRAGRRVIATRTVHGDRAAGNSSNAVWDVLVQVRDPELPFDARDRVIGSAGDRVAFDRRSSEAVDCCGAHVNGETDIKHAGIEYKFPFHTERRSYAYFDLTLGRAVPARFDGEERVQGLLTYRFLQRVRLTKLAAVAVPGELVGSNDPVVELSRFYSNVRILNVEPLTGTIVRAREQPYIALFDADGADRLTVVDADLTFDRPTVTQQIRSARQLIRRGNRLTDTGPALALGVGVASIAAGLALVLPKRPREQELIDAV